MEGARVVTRCVCSWNVVKNKRAVFLFSPFSFGLVSGLFPFISELDQANHI